MKKLLGLFAAVLVSLGLTGGIAAANMGAIDTTGPGSYNKINDRDNSRLNLDNDTDVRANITTNQNADTGSARSSFNTTGGGAASGDAENDSQLDADISIDNSGSSSAALACACGSGSSSNSSSIDNTGPLSRNYVEHQDNSRVDVDNDTDVVFTNRVNQAARSGDATVSLNTMGGDATSGNASNSSSTVFSFSATN